MIENSFRTNISISKKILIQRGNFKDNINEIALCDIEGLNDIIGLASMDFSEFKYGALTRSLKRMTLNKEDFSIREFSEYKDKNGNTLKIYTSNTILYHVKKVVDNLVRSSVGIQPYCSLCDHVVKPGQKKHYDGYYVDDNFWWDIDNDFFMFFEHGDKLQIALDKMAKSSDYYYDVESRVGFKEPNKIINRM